MLRNIHNKHSILWVLVDGVSFQESEALFSNWLTEEKSSFHGVVTVNPEFVMEARKNSYFRNILNKSDMALSDGFGIVCAHYFLYGKIVKRITGVQATLLLVSLCEKLQKKVYLLGGDSGVAVKTAEVLKKKFPTVQIVGAEEGILRKIHDSRFTIHDLKQKETQVEGASYELRVMGYEDDLEINKQICSRITDSKADILLVAFGAPKQEVWISENKKNLPHIRIAMGVGGTFDYLAGVVPYCPAFFRAIGLEWLFRLCVEPRRWKRIFTAVIIFPLAIFFYKLKLLK